MRSIFGYAPLLCLLGFAYPSAHAQSGFDIAVGFGAAQTSAASGGIEGNPVSQNFFNSCVAGSSSTCVRPKGLSGFRMGVSGNLMLWQHFGVGAAVTFQPGKQDYVTFPQSVIQAGGANLESRTTFYDFNGIFQPIKTKKVAVQLLGGIGGANLKFYASGSTTDAIVGTTNFSQFYGSSNHFQVHAGAGIAFYLTDNIFIRPQFDLHYVPNLSQFGSNAVTEETVWLGYSWGSQ